MNISLFAATSRVHVAPPCRRWRGVAALAGCMMDPPGPSPIYSRLPADQSGMASTAATAHARRARALRRRSTIRCMAEQNQAIAAENAAQAWSRYYSAAVSVYGSYYGGGWGHGWGTGVGIGYGRLGLVMTERAKRRTPNAGDQSGPARRC